MKFIKNSFDSANPFCSKQTHEEELKIVSQNIEKGVYLVVVRFASFSTTAIDQRLPKLKNKSALSFPTFLCY